MRSLSPSHSQPARRPRREQGWVLLATFIISSIAASLTVAFARHAVLAKSGLEMSHGASETEEATRSTLQRTRQEMRRGGNPDVEVETADGDLVTIERTVDGHDRREVKLQAQRPGGDVFEQASLRARARIVPANDSSASPTRLDCTTGASIAAGLTIISGTVDYQDTEVAGLLLLEEGSVLNLEDVVLRGTILTNAGLCGSNAPVTGATRPVVNLFGGVRLLAGTELPDVAMVAPDARVIADASARVEMDGMVIADELDLPCRGTLRGMVVHEESESLDAAVQRPGYGRGPQSWPASVVAGAERVTQMSFPVDPYTEEELDLMESFDADDY